jgi:hypothetical protein
MSFSITKRYKIVQIISIKNLSCKVLLWIRICIGSGFNDFLDPFPE